MPGPHWDGNQVWLITAAGALFAAWPVKSMRRPSTAFTAMSWRCSRCSPLGFDVGPRSTGDAGAPLGLGADGWSDAGADLGWLRQLLQVPFHFDELHRLDYTGSF